MDALEALRTRRSVRAYENRPVSKEDLETLVDCGRLAATARNAQPWEFIVVTEEDGLRALAKLADNGKFIADAAACIAVFCEDSDYYLEDGCAATQNILVAACALGLASCWVAGDRKPYAEKVCALLGAPAGYKLISLVPVGYSSETPNPVKRPLEDVIHWEHFTGA